MLQSLCQKRSWICLLLLSESADGMSTALSHLQSLEAIVLPEARPDRLQIPDLRWGSTHYCREISRESQFISRGHPTADITGLCTLPSTLRSALVVLWAQISPHIHDGIFILWAHVDDEDAASDDAIDGQILLITRPGQRLAQCGGITCKCCWHLPWLC